MSISSLLHLILVSLLPILPGQGEKAIQNLYEVKLNIALKNDPLNVVFAKLEKQSGFHINYAPADINPALLLSMNYTQIPLSRILLDINKVSGLEFKQVNQSICVRKGKASQNKIEVLIRK